MSDFVTLATKFPWTPENPMAGRDQKAELVLHNAYIAFRNGRATIEQAELILTDLAKASGYYNTTAADADPHVVKYHEGQRSIFGRVLRLMNPTSRELESLQKAVVEEMQRTAETGRDL